MGISATQNYALAKDGFSIEVIDFTTALYEVALRLPREIKDRRKAATSAIMADISDSLGELRTVVHESPKLIEVSFLDELIENAVFTIELIGKKCGEGNDESAAVIAEFQLIPLVLEIREDFYFWYCVCRSRGNLDYYYAEEFARNHKNIYVEQNKERYETSIVVVAFNKLEYTKKCVESIIEYTDFKKQNCELVLINHGSTDDTQQYFDSFKGAKVINLKKNMRILMFTIAYRILEGKYSVLINNDAVVTKGWYNRLRDCITSDPNIVTVCPITPNLSNYQSIAVSYTNLSEFHEFAERFNVRNPAKWHRRARLMPTLAMYNNRLVNEIGLMDRRFKMMEFADDDFSLRARRRGFLQILCKDFICHHYGSVTSKEGQIKENTLGKGRRLFMEKNGVDAWGSGFCYNRYIIGEIQKQVVPDKLTANILGVDSGFGDTLLGIGNVLRERGIDSKIYAITRNKAYKPDLEAISEEAAVVEEGSVLGLFNNVKFDYIVIEDKLEEYADWKLLLRELAGMLTNTGVLVFGFSNGFFLRRGASMAVQHETKEGVSYLKPDEVTQYTVSLSLSSYSIGAEGRFGNIEEYISGHLDYAISDEERTELAKLMSVESFMVFSSHKYGI